jgi:hypothetical protein
MSEKKSSKRKIEICIESPKKIKIEKKYETFPLTKIISGGQTGADFGALMAAEVLGIQTGGTAPQEFWTSDGKCPELGSRFKLVELSLKKPSTLSMMYVERSKKNVDNSDGTIAFRLHSSVGTDKTIGYCITKVWKVQNFKNYKKLAYRPLLVIENLSDKTNISKIRSFIKENKIKILNVCGHRENKDVSG